MTKKIEKMSQLLREQRRLRERRIALEGTIRADWRKMWYTMKPVALLREAVWSGVRSLGAKLLSK